MSYNFTSSTNRENSNAEKYQAREKLFGTKDVLPAWVADMDINTPSFVLDAVKKRLEHPITGYEYVPDSAYEAQIEWVKKKYGMSLTKEMICHSYSVVTLMNVAIEAFSDEGDGVIIQTPIYPPFSHFVKEYKRKIVNNPLRLREDGTYTFDVEDLRAKIDKNTKLLLLCSPHNPVGRVWKREELEAILEVCLEHNIVVFADEIHSDLVFAPHQHIPFASLSAEAAKITITAMGTGKTFNMAGFAMGSVAIVDEELRKKFLAVYNRIHLSQGNVLSHVAVEAAYREGDTWLEALTLHLQNNYQALETLLGNYSHAIKLTPLEGTYLAWLDCRAMGFSDKELREFFTQECRLGLSAGISFGREGSGFMRLNFAVPSDTMTEILNRLENGLKKRF
jgi:cystathionine beta-lyase